MGQIIRLKDDNGQPIEFVDEIKAQGGVKDVYFSPDRSHVVGFFRNSPDPTSLERLKLLTGRYKEQIFTQAGGDYWRKVFSWPESMVYWEGRVGLKAATFPQNFFFAHGSLNNDALQFRGKEKSGKWFASAKLHYKLLDPQERGDWLGYIRLCLQIARGVHRLHAAGLAHSDLSYNNVLLDPVNVRALILDIDTLVVPTKFPPEVLGTPDFFAPEVMATQHLDLRDPNRKLPSISTDLHALAVLIYMYLFYRHPLVGKKIHDPTDDARDTTLAMGEKALFIEHPTDSSNRPNLGGLKLPEATWQDVNKHPCRIAGPYLRELFTRAFVDGLHQPNLRPAAAEWVQALTKTIDLIQPCSNPSCEQKWYVFDNSTSPACPFCGSSYRGLLPVLNLYSSRHGGEFRSDNHRLMVYTNQSIFVWHINRNKPPSERLSEADQKRVGYFVYHNGTWYLVNEAMPDLEVISGQTKVPIGQHLKLDNDQQILFSRQDGGRLALVQMVRGL